MRLKEIKPGMAVHCKSIDEKKALYDELCRIGNMKTDSYTDSFDNFKDSNCNYKICDLKRETWCFTTEPATVEFSDLIIPDLTAAEAVQWIVLHYGDGAYAEAFGVDCRIEFLLDDMSAEEVVSKIIQWKSDHEKKEPKIETVDICRIIEIQPDGHKRCVHEEDLASGSTDAEIKILVEAELKRYCMEHDGEFIAVHEVVSRVKVVE